MTLRTRHNSRFGISIAASALAGAFLLGACGGGSSDDDAADVTPAGGDADLEQAQDLVDGAVADTSGDATATVVADGTTYEFRTGTDSDGETAFCTTVAGSLQGWLLLVDESGAVVEDGDVTFTLFPADAPYAEGGSLQEVSVNLPTGPDVIGPMMYLSDADTIESEVSGSSATATFTARSGHGDLSGTIDISC